MYSAEAERARRLQIPLLVLLWVCCCPFEAHAQGGYWALRLEQGDPPVLITHGTFEPGRPVVESSDGTTYFLHASSHVTPEWPLEFYGAIGIGRPFDLSPGVYEFTPTWQSPDRFAERPPGNFLWFDQRDKLPACASPRVRYTVHELRIGAVPDQWRTYPVEALSYDGELRCADSNSARFFQYRYNPTRTAARVGALTIEHQGPTVAGEAVQLRVDGEAGAAPLEYKFWRYRFSTGVWTEVQDYSLNPTYRWTATDIDTYYFQAWSRTRGSTAAYDTYRVLGPITVQPVAGTLEALTADVSLPVQTGQTTTWTARARGGVRLPLEYQFWHFSKSGWQIAQPWGPNNTFSWTPTWTDEGTHAIQAWVRSAGSSAQYEGWKSSGLFNVLRSPLQLTTATPFPVAPGTPITWQAGMADHVSTLEYQFWVFTQQTGWTIGQSYGPSQTFTWTPMLAGTYALQVWARQVGSTASYEAWRSTNFIQISPSPPRVLRLSADAVSDITLGTTLRWTAIASGGTSRLQYQFWRFDATGWSVVQPWGDSNSYSWTLGAADVGQHYLQVRVRSLGSTAEYEAYLSVPSYIRFSSPSPPPLMIDFTADVPLPASIGTTITWTVTVSGSVGPYTYELNQLDPNGYWHLVLYQRTSGSASYSWTPGPADTGLHELYLRVSSGNYESAGERSTGFFKITP